MIKTKSPLFIEHTVDYEILLNMPLNSRLDKWYQNNITIRGVSRCNKDNDERLIKRCDKTNFHLPPCWFNTNCLNESHNTSTIHR